MAPKKNDEGGDEKGKKKEKGEKAKTKSPAEFFSENKAVAGRQSRQVALRRSASSSRTRSTRASRSRSCRTLRISIQELDGAELNRTLRPRPARSARRVALREGGKGGPKSKAAQAKAAAAAAAAAAAGDDDDDAPAAAEKAAPKGKKGAEALYYRVVVRDNGCGMKHEQIPEMLGRVLSGSKYGVRQTRGKFGLGAKMALIWSKQSTGMPIEVRSSTSPNNQISACVLDIDIQKNEPRIKLHEKLDNNEGMRGSEISLLVGGAWSSYRSYIVRYLRQMAVITPYARFRLTVGTLADKNILKLDYARRSEEMPKPPSTIKHHPVVRPRSS